MYFCWQPVPTLRILRLPAPSRHDFGGSFCYLNRFGFRSSSGRTSEGVAWGLPGGWLGVARGFRGMHPSKPPGNPLERVSQFPRWWEWIPTGWLAGADCRLLQYPVECRAVEFTGKTLEIRHEWYLKVTDARWRVSLQIRNINLKVWIWLF